MIRLSVTLDAGLLDLTAAEWPAIGRRWAEVRERYGLADAPDAEPEAVFAAGPAPDASDLASYRRTAAELARRLPESVGHIERFLPATAADVAHALRVVLVPHGQVNFGPVPGVQLFSLLPGADPVETYLFLVHVYYHELSDLFDPPAARRYTLEQRTAEDFRRWVRLLIRNEGIGNHAVMADVMRFAADHPGYEFRYFTYAPLVGREGPLEQSVEVLRQALAAVTDENVRRYRSRVNAIFKNKQLPIINLVGTHMAGVIAERLGLPALKDVHQAEADRFFERYAAAGGPFATALSTGVGASP